VEENLMEDKKELNSEQIEKEQSLVSYLKNQFHQENVDLRTYSPLTLAYIGDAIYELIIRTLLVDEGNMQVNKLHRKATGLVKAEKQSQMIEILKPHFTEDEMQIYKRGRNAKSFTSAKNASITDYRRATGFEAVMGYLYLGGEYHRMIDLIKLGLRS
jgi:ribonuclease-3 family protein